MLRWLFNIAFAALLLYALKRAPWRSLTQPVLLNVWLGITVTLLGLWQIKAGIKPGLDLHLLGASAFTLITGWALAVVGLSIVMLVATLLGDGGLSNLPFHGIMLIALPVGLTQLALRLNNRYLPRHLFVYLFACVFFGTALAMAATAFATNALLAWAAVYPARYLYHDYLPYFLLLSGPEALITGMVLTLMVVFRPQWVASFDDRVYYGEPPSR